MDTSPQITLNEFFSRFALMYCLIVLIRSLDPTNEYEWLRKTTSGVTLLCE